MPGSKRESAEWRKSGESAPLQMRSGTSHRRSLMLTVFWNSSGIQLVDFADRGTRINSQYYSNLLSAVRKKVRKPRNIPLFLLHDNATIHTSQETTTAVTKNGLYSNCWSILLTHLISPQVTSICLDFWRSIFVVTISNRQRNYRLALLSFLIHWHPHFLNKLSVNWNIVGRKWLMLTGHTLKSKRFAGIYFVFREIKH